MKSTKVIKNEKVKKQSNEDKASIHVRWLDNGQVMMEILCYPDEIDALKELFDFVEEMNGKEYEEP